VLSKEHDFTDNSPSARGQTCAATSKKPPPGETHRVQNLQQAVARLREQPYSAVALGPFLLENEPEESDQVLEHLDTAVPEVPAPAPEKIRMIGQYDRTISLATCG
jgi:hypothetical protein